LDAPFSANLAQFIADELLGWAEGLTQLI
jgi:hypothetical protein